MCLSTGIAWETYWSLTGPELAALGAASDRIAERRKRRSKKGR